MADSKAVGNDQDSTVGRSLCAAAEGAGTVYTYNPLLNPDRIMPLLWVAGYTGQFNHMVRPIVLIASVSKPRLVRFCVVSARSASVITQINQAAGQEKK